MGFLFSIVCMFSFFFVSHFIASSIARVSARTYTLQLVHYVQYVGTWIHELSHIIAGLPFGITPTGIRVSFNAQDEIPGVATLEYRRSILSWVGLGVVGMSPWIASLLLATGIRPLSCSFIQLYKTGDWIYGYNVLEISILIISFIFGGPFWQRLTPSKKDYQLSALSICFMISVTILVVEFFFAGRNQIIYDYAMKWLIPAMISYSVLLIIAFPLPLLLLLFQRINK